VALVDSESVASLAWGRIQSERRLPRVRPPSKCSITKKSSMARERAT